MLYHERLSPISKIYTSETIPIHWLPPSIRSLFLTERGDQFSARRKLYFTYHRKFLKIWAPSRIKMNELTSWFNNDNKFEILECYFFQINLKNASASRDSSNYNFKWYTFSKKVSWYKFSTDFIFFLAISKNNKKFLS